MESLNSIIGVGVILLCVVIPMIIWIFISNLPELLLDRMIWKKIDESEQAEEKAENDFINSVIEIGILAPANILSIHGLGHRKKSPGTSFRTKAMMEVEVTPEGKPSFKSQFNWWISHSTKLDFHDYADAMIKKRQIWVMYNPNNPAEMIFSHYPEDHELALRQIEFNKISKGNEILKQTGEPAEALITRVEDLDLPYPAKKSRAMRIEFKVTPNSGPSFEADGHFLIGDVAIQKYSVGKKVFVRFDPSDPKKAVLDSERNKSLK